MPKLIIVDEIKMDRSMNEEGSEAPPAVTEVHPNPFRQKIILYIYN